MASTTRGQNSYGDGQDDIAPERRDYSAATGFVVDHVSPPRCACGGCHFLLAVNDVEGVAVRQCWACGAEHVPLDGAEFLDGADPQQCACPCGGEPFEITIGFSLKRDSPAVRWVYAGCRCISCGPLGVYADWKTGGGDVEAFVALV